jgi:hypothetical protein
MRQITPLCRRCNSLLWKTNEKSKNWEYFNCKKCNYSEAELKGKWLPTDENTNELFYQIAQKLSYELSIEIKKAIEYTEDFYLKFINEKYCKSIGTNPKDDDFFHHEYFGLLFYIKYFIIDKKEQNIDKFYDWYFKNRS